MTDYAKLIGENEGMAVDYGGGLPETYNSNGDINGDYAFFGGRPKRGIIFDGGVYALDIQGHRSGVNVALRYVSSEEIASLVDNDEMSGTTFRIREPSSLEQGVIDALREGKSQATTSFSITMNKRK